MNKMEHCKLQAGCLIIVLYIAFIYIKEKEEYKTGKRNNAFEHLLISGIVSIIFDAITAYTVNNRQIIPDVVNNILHICFLCSLDIIVYMMFMHIMQFTVGLPKQKQNRIILKLPLIVNILTVLMFIDKLEYRHGTITDYSMGIPAYTCFVMVVIYISATIIIIFTGRKNLGRHKLITLLTYVGCTTAVALFQIIHPQALVSCLVPTIAITGSYLNMENPVFTLLKNYNNEMVMGFANLVENRDGSTGGHIKRTTEYVRLLAFELKNRGFYTEILTKDYINNLVMAAPMHDVGKIAIPDAVLQKPGRLTKEEFEIMKTHAEKGGQIIEENFAHTGNDDYKKIACNVARYHHEKWNGKGYPQGLSGNDIPLSARIMAVADVFDAVSAKRCYRDAMPLEECFKIIKDGIGEDFDPVIGVTFINIKDRVILIKKTFE